MPGIRKHVPLLAAVLGMIVLLTSSPAGAEIDFETWRAWPAGDDLRALTMSDLNDDGIQDLAVVNRLDDTVAILLGDGAGGFEAPRFTNVADNPLRIAAGDVNGDGAIDLAVAPDNGLEVLLGNGDGTFQPGSLIIDKIPFNDVGLADLDGDGALDLIAIFSFDGVVFVLLGNGDGTFQPEAGYQVDSYALSISVGMLDGDQIPDLAVSCFSWSSICTLRGNGDGSFQPYVRNDVGDQPHSVTIVDLNGDGDNDLVTANYDSDDLSVLLGNGDGTFEASVEYPVGEAPLAVVATDLDNDGDLDLASNTTTGAMVSLLAGNGDGTFQPAENEWAGNEQWDIVSGDFDGDGNADLALTAYQADIVCVLRGQGDGSFRTPPTYAVGDDPVSAAVADFDGDGHLDAATANRDDESVSVLLGDGQGEFGPVTDYGLTDRARWIIAENLDDDGAVDLAVLSNNNIEVLLGNGNGTFHSAALYSCGEDPERFITGDLNGDTYPDIAAFDHENSTLIILLNNGDGTFQAAVVYEDVLVLPSGIAAVDMDFDGDLDLAVPSDFAFALTFFLNGGDGTFDNHQSMYAGDFVSDIVAADLNGDAIPDLALSDEQVHSGAVLHICLGRPEGFYDDPVTIPGGHAATMLIAEDLDGDGCLDLASANGWYHTISVLQGYGNGTFGAPLLFGAAGQAWALAAGDLDGDGRPDLVMPNLLGDDLAVLINDSEASPLIFTGPGPGYDNPPEVRVFNLRAGGDPLVTFAAYGPDRYGVNVASGSLTGSALPAILTGAGPGDIYGPHVRGFTVQGEPLAGLSFLAYGTNKWGVNVAAGDIDGDGYDEIITGAGPGEVFGPHVRAFDYDGTPGVTPVPGVSYFAYGTPKWGANVAAGDIDGDGYDEILTGPGPGNIYGPHIRGWDVDGGSATAIGAVSYLAYGTNKKGAKVTCGDLDGDGIDEIVTSPGPSSFFAAHVRGWNYDGASLSAMADVSFFAWPSSAARYGANVEAGTDLDGDGRADLLVGGGPDPAIGTEVKVFTYDGSQVSEWAVFEAFPGLAGGATVAVGEF